MKKLFTLTFALAINFSFAQKPIGEKDAITKSHIDFTKEYLIFSINGMIEIDGHTFKNDTLKCAIVFQAGLTGVTIADTCRKTEYNYHKCQLANCKIIHLTKVESNTYRTPIGNLRFPCCADQLNYVITPGFLGNPGLGTTPAVLINPETENWLSPTNNSKISIVPN